MPILALLPLIFAALKVVMAIIEYLQAHPEIEAGAKATLGNAYKALEAAQGHVQDVANTYPQGNNIEAP
jgi:hypothetical protein